MIYLTPKQSGKIGLYTLVISIPILYAGFTGDNMLSGLDTQLIGGGMAGISLASFAFAGTGKLAERLKKKYGITYPD